MENVGNAHVHFNFDYHEITHHKHWVYQRCTLLPFYRNSVYQIITNYIEHILLMVIVNDSQLPSKVNAVSFVCLGKLNFDITRLSQVIWGQCLPEWYFVWCEKYSKHRIVLQFLATIQAFEVFFQEGIGRKNVLPRMKCFPRDEDSNTWDQKWDKNKIKNHNCKFFWLYTTCCKSINLPPG